MIDERFYRLKGPIQLSDIVKESGAQADNLVDREIVAPAASHLAGPKEICFAEGNAKSAAAVSTEAGACFVTESNVEHLPEGVQPLVHGQPRLALQKTSRTLVDRYVLGRQHHHVSQDAQVDGSALISPGVVIGPHAKIGPKVHLGANCVIGPGVEIGEGTYIGAGCSIETALIGKHVFIQANTTIGSTGFGVIPTAEGMIDNPHFGRVIIEDHVTLGASVCVDRGVFSDTRIGARSKIDNLVQIAHNVTIGEDCLIAAFGGISGSVEVGSRAMLGGRVGIADHVTVGEGARLAADAAVMRDVPPGETWGGTPAKSMQKTLREWAWVAKNSAKR